MLQMCLDLITNPNTTTTGGSPTTSPASPQPQTKSGTTGTGIGQTPQTPTTIDEDANYTFVDAKIIKSTNYPAVVPENSDSVFNFAKQIANENYQQFNTEILSGVTSCVSGVIKCLTDGRYASALNNSIVAIYRLLLGIFKGLGRVFMDFATFLFEFGGDFYKYGLGVFWGLLFSIGQAMFNIPSIIKSLLPTARNITDYRAMSYYSKMEHHGYHLAYIGASVYLAAKSVLEIANTSIAIAGTIKNSLLGTKNIANVMVGVEALPGLVVRQTNSGSQVFKGIELAAQSLDDVAKYAPSAVADMKSLSMINFVENVKAGQTIQTTKGSVTIPSNFTTRLPANKGFGYKFRDGLGIEYRVMGPNNIYPNGYVKKLINNQSLVDINDNIPSPAVYRTCLHLI